MSTDPMMSSPQDQGADAGRVPVSGGHSSSQVTRDTSHVNVMNHRRNAMNIGKDEPFKSEMGMRPLKASEVLLSTFS